MDAQAVDRGLHCLPIFAKAVDHGIHCLPMFNPLQLKMRKTSWMLKMSFVKRFYFILALFVKMKHQESIKFV